MIFALLLACADPQPTEAPPPPEAPVGLHPSADVAPCDPEREPVDVGRTVALRVFVDDGVDPASARALVDGAVAWWAAQGVELVVSEPRIVDLAAPLGGSPEAVDAGLRDRGIDPDAPLDEASKAAAREIIGEVVFAPVRAHLQQHAVPARDGVDVVISPRLAAPESPADQAFTRIDGLTLRADLADRQDPTGELVRLLDLPDFTPSVLVGLAGPSARSPDTFEGTLTHELGHALGLDHVTDPHNLMVAQPPTCVPHLAPEQAEALAGAGSTQGGKSEQEPSP